jgi:hypothetical protein
MTLDVHQAYKRVDALCKLEMDGVEIAESLYFEGYTLAVASTALTRYGFSVAIMPVENTLNILMISPVIPKLKHEEMHFKPVYWVPKEGNPNMKAPKQATEYEVFVNPAFGLPCVDVMMNGEILRELVIRWFEKKPSGGEYGYILLRDCSESHILRVDMSKIQK